MATHHGKRKKPEQYQRRFYRNWVENSGLLHVEVKVQETDLSVQSDIEVAARAKELVIELRLQLENYITTHRDFLTSLSPLGSDPSAPPIIKDMLVAAEQTEVGPMAAVAGAMAERVGKQLILEGCSEIIIENGGDLFLHRSCDVTAAVYAGESPLSNRIGIKLEKNSFPCGVCTSSGAIGHSLSLGEADSVTVVAKSTPLADAAATRLGNQIGRDVDVNKSVEDGLNLAMTIPGVDGAVIICGEVMGAIGEVELVRL